MICPTCKEKRRKSCVQAGIVETTLGYYPLFYDEYGRLHVHDRNRSTTSYQCGNGHEWTEAKTGSCWCGWPDKKGGV